MTTRLLSPMMAATLVALLAASAEAQSQTTQVETTQVQITNTQTTQIQTATPQTTTRPTYEAAVGYQWLRAGAFCIDEIDEETCPRTGEDYPFGLMGDVVRNWGAFGLAGEAGWSHRSRDVDGLGSRVTNDVFHVAAGPRWTFRAGRVWPYVQVQGGVAVLRFDADLIASNFTDSKIRPLAQGGAGITFVTGDGWGLFVQGDYRRVFLDEDEDFGTGRNDVRAIVGLRMILD